MRSPEDELLDLHEALLEQGQAGRTTQLPGALRARILAEAVPCVPRPARGRDLGLRLAACAASLLGLLLVSPETLAATRPSPGELVERASASWEAVVTAERGGARWEATVADVGSPWPWLLGATALALCGAGLWVSTRRESRP